MPTGTRRNVGFACLGLGQPLGFSFGLVFGGILESSSLGWRFGYYLCTGVALILVVINYFKLPNSSWHQTTSWGGLKEEIDWIGLALSSSSLGILSYVFAYANLAPDVIAVSKTQADQGKWFGLVSSRETSPALEKDRILRCSVSRQRYYRHFFFG
jgi:MFS family permease